MDAPAGFDLDLTVRSHGFYDLPPWTYDRARRLLGRPLALGERAAYVEVAPVDGAPGGLTVRVVAADGARRHLARDATTALRRCLALDDDLAPFHRRVEEIAAAEERRRAQAPDTGADQRGRRIAPPDLRWAVRRGAGRMLRSPTVFEDAVKTLCTTNCTWAVTKGVVSRLIEHLGREAPLGSGSRCFPEPAAMAERPERFYRDVIRAGYRAAFLRALARAAASGAVDLEGWRHSALPTPELARAIADLPGFGPYATEHMLRLLGRHDHLALDSWIRGKVPRMLGRTRAMTDRAIARRYAPFGEWAGLALWLDVTADWHDGEPA